MHHFLCCNPQRVCHWAYGFYHCNGYGHGHCHRFFISMIPPFITFSYLPPNSRRPWPSAKPPGRSASQKKNSHAPSPAVPLIGLESQNLEITTFNDIQHLKYKLSNLFMKPLSTSTHHTEWFCSKDCSTECTARRTPSLGSWTDDDGGDDDGDDDKNQKEE